MFLGGSEVGVSSVLNSSSPRVGSLTHKTRYKIEKLVHVVKVDPETQIVSLFISHLVVMFESLPPSFTFSFSTF